MDQNLEAVPEGDNMWLFMRDVRETMKDQTNKVVSKKVENVSLVERFSSRRNAVGSLYLTATHVIYVDHDNKRETWILHSHISSVTKLPLTPQGSPLQVRTKTFLSMTFIIPKERDAHDLHQLLVQMCQPESIEALYCFRYSQGIEDLPREAGWSLFDLQTEFERMGVPNETWTMTLLNKEYELCDTYPRYLYVPTSAPTNVLIGSSRFRSRGRLPVLTYLHQNKAALCRCSQPLSGFSARCVEDENLLVCVQKANPNTAQLVVVDTRPRINAMANRAAGKGYESEANYENTRFMFAGIDNIHVMRQSLGRLLDACDLKTPMMGAFINGLEGSGWLRHIKSIIDAAVSIAKTLEDGSSVLVHCSDGWDRTAQVCGLAQVLIDPYYRTLHGFQALIAKEWLAYGHKFTDRCGHIQIDPKEISPVFTQWLEAVWQITQQFPAAFQFNDRLLLAIHDHVHSCQFGTFIGNCQKDRVDLRLEEKTYSFWGYIATHMNEYLSPLYKPDLNVGFIEPNVAPQTFKFWRELYCRWESGLHPRESLSDLMVAAKSHLNSLDDHIRLLHKRIKLSEQKLGAPINNGVNDNKNKNDSSVLYLTDNRLSYSKPLQNEVNLKLKHNIDYDPLMNNHVDVDKTVVGIDGHRTWGCLEEKRDSFDSDGQFLEDGNIDTLIDELESVAIEWKSVRGAKECPCSTPLDFATRKSHCWRCGEIYCSRCLDQWVTLPGHMSQKQSPVCRQCYRVIVKSNSLESPE
ncbi:unnamed protein product [Orchesella dallaii]|uniref:phosphatidylinositol-3,5-bisphosphate 3-phosphatase n=1 Tax=Orchesella dallaii TaxID=48710 RepID=A0ABP1PXQ3_9HEXA